MSALTCMCYDRIIIKSTYSPNQTAQTEGHPFEGTVRSNCLPETDEYDKIGSYHRPPWFLRNFYNNPGNDIVTLYTVYKNILFIILEENISISKVNPLSQ